MNIFLLSDLHLETGQDFPDAPPETDVVVLAGDIDKSTLSISLAFYYRNQIKKPVIVIAGNHEFYGGDYLRILSNIRQEAARDDDIHFLENDSIQIDDTIFHGCTLWTNFELYGRYKRKKMMRTADWAINDFRRIGLNSAAFRPQDALELFQASYAWLESQLAKPFSGKTVVVTHFAPHRAAIHSRHSGGDEVTPYFVPDCSDLIRKYNIDLWMYGHTHNSVDAIVEGKTRLVSNQVGYPREDPEYVRFDPNKIIVL